MTPFLKQIWLVLPLVISVASVSCVPPSAAFYVQDSAKLKSVMVTECSEVTFRDIDTGKLAKRQACSKYTLNGQQRRVFEKMRTEMNDPSKVAVSAQPGDLEEVP